LKAGVPVVILSFEKDLDEYIADWKAQIMDFLKRKGQEEQILQLKIPGVSGCRPGPRPLERGPGAVQGRRRSDSGIG
jgi:hypothetical protein